MYAGNSKSIYILLNTKLFLPIKTHNIKQI